VPKPLASPRGPQPVTSGIRARGGRPRAFDRGYSAASGRLKSTAREMTRLPGGPEDHRTTSRPGQRSARLSRTDGLGARRREPRPGGSRVHCDSLGEVGARLCHSDLATSTPQTFSVASRTGLSRPAGSSRRNGKQRDAPRPAQIRQVRAGVKIEGRNNAGSSRTPLRHARRTRPIWQY